LIDALEVAELTFVFIGDENTSQCLRQLAAPSARVVDGGLEEEWNKAPGHDVLPDLVERNDLLDAVGRNEAVRDGGERSSSVEKVCARESMWL
jgi:hypothetical protein